MRPIFGTKTAFCFVEKLIRYTQERLQKVTEKVEGYHCRNNQNRIHTKVNTKDILNYLDEAKSVLHRYRVLREK